MQYPFISPSDVFSSQREKQILTHRLRRARQAPWIRRLMQEHRLSVTDLILPLFVTEEDHAQNGEVISSMPGIKRYNIESMLKCVEEAVDLGITAVILFPYISESLRNDEATEGFNEDNLICRACRAIKAQNLDIGIICDVALDPYTSHGHDGLIESGQIVNDLTLAALSRLALNYAQAGADIVAPSDMMDGRVRFIRQALEKEGFQNVLIMAYAVKYASAFYGPFREALGTQSLLVGDKRTYQMDPANDQESFREVALDIQEGADMVLIKPGGLYLDIIKQTHDHFNIPVFAYQVSGEYAMIAAAAANGWIDRSAAVWESLIAFKRAGCTGIVTYFALEMARQLAA